jgi:pyruvate,water dikinase
MNFSLKYIIPCAEISEENRGEVGSKSFGIHRLTLAGLPVPKSLVLTTNAYVEYLEHNHFFPLLTELDKIEFNCHDLADTAEKVSAKIRSGKFPESITKDLQTEVQKIDSINNTSTRLAVRSSCTYEDLDGTSFAGLYKTFLNVPASELLPKILECYASLFSPRALTYLKTNNISVKDLRMGVLIQELIDADAAGTIFTAEPDSGFAENIQIEAVHGFGEGLVSGHITPDSWTVSKRNGKVIGRSFGGDNNMYIVNGNEGLNVVSKSIEQQNSLCMEEFDIELLAGCAKRLEILEGYPLDIEWVKSKNGKIFFLQVRPLTCVAHNNFLIRYEIIDSQKQKPLLRGKPITEQVVTGRVRVLKRPEEVTQEEILVVENLDPNWLPFIKNAKGIVVESGGYTSHMSIILREHNIPSIFGAQDACSKLQEAQQVTLACLGNEAIVWDGEPNVKKTVVDVTKIQKPEHHIYAVTSTIANLDQFLKLPLDGIGLVRLEFIIWQLIGVHPLALVDYDLRKPQPLEIQQAIQQKIRGFKSAREWYMEKLTEGICIFASRCPEKVVNVRLPDFTSDDYLQLLGSEKIKSVDESNPMLGWRGTSRLIEESNRCAFELDCEALRRAVEDLGFNNVQVMVPFCRTPEDGATIRRIVQEKGPRNARVGMMVEIPSNVMLAQDFAKIFDFFLVGPMDLTQLTYGADRTSAKLSKYCNEVKAVKEMVKCLFTNLAGFEKDVYIGTWPLFQFLEEYEYLRGKNRIHLAELPDRLLEAFDKVNQLEQKMKSL